MRILPSLFVSVCLCASHLAVAQSTPGVRAGIGCKDFLAMVDHRRPAIADWVTQPKRHPVVWSDNGLVIGAAVPDGLIVDACRTPR